jgi:hypothetical protein
VDWVHDPWTGGSRQHMVDQKQGRGGGSPQLSGTTARARWCLPWGGGGRRTRHGSVSDALGGDREAVMK